MPSSGRPNSRGPLKEAPLQDQPRSLAPPGSTEWSSNPSNWRDERKEDAGRRRKRPGDGEDELRGGGASGRNPSHPRVDQTRTTWGVAKPLSNELGPTCSDRGMALDDWIVGSTTFACNNRIKGKK
jgi:hypothetical protein